ncbi:MAG: histone deacetylase [Verrucomicrobia bacterium]|nr:histone deacetylase [Verrucomicrobiota bacterium]
MHVFHDARCAEYGRAGHPDRPERILRTVPLLKEKHQGWKWTHPEATTRDQLLLVHSPEYIDEVCFSRADFDSDCPAYPHIYDHAARAAGSAISAARNAGKGEASFSLMRPPGHHALRGRAMGFCYFSNIALAGLDALRRGVERVAIWDFDAHHGNGTEALVAHHERIAFASIHQYPGWPGTGTRSFANIHNYPIAPYSPRAHHMAAAERSLEVLLSVEPQLLLVSAGFDAFANDPITQMTLEIEDFASFGTWLRQLDVPVAAILEGGYSDELPELVNAFLSEWDNC